MNKSFKQLLATSLIISLLTSSAGITQPADANEPKDTIDVKITDLMKEFNKYPKQTEQLGDANANYKLYYVNKNNQYRRIDPQLKYPMKTLNNRSAMAIRDMEKVLKIRLYWRSKERLVIAKNTGNESDVDTVVYPVNRRAYSVDGNVKQLDTSATILPGFGRTYLPVRSISESLGYQIVFVKKDNSVWVAEDGADVTKVIKEEEKKDDNLPEKDKKNLTESELYEKMGDTELAEKARKEEEQHKKNLEEIAKNNKNSEYPFNFKLTDENGNTHEVRNLFHITSRETGFSTPIAIPGPIYDGDEGPGTPMTVQEFLSKHPQFKDFKFYSQNPNMKVYEVTPTTKFRFGGDTGDRYIYPTIGYNHIGATFMSDWGDKDLGNTIQVPSFDALSIYKDGSTQRADGGLKLNSKKTIKEIYFTFLGNDKAAFYIDYSKYYK